MKSNYGIDKILGRGRNERRPKEVLTYPQPKPKRIKEPLVANGNDLYGIRDIQFVVDPYGRSRPDRMTPAAEVEALKLKVAEQEAVLVQQDALLKVMTQPPFVRAIVLALGRDEVTSTDPTKPGVAATVVIGAGGQNLEVPVPPGMKLGIGSVVRVSAKTMAIVEVVKGMSELPNGIIMTIAGVVDSGVAEVDIGGTKKLVQTPMKVEKGDRALVDVSMTYVLKNLGKQSEDFKTEVERITTTWEDIGGQKLAKTEMREAIEGPIMHKEIFKAYGKKAVKGILLYGPPGCGKTMFAKAAANALAQLHGKTAGTGFIYVKGPEILNKWVGQSEETIRNLFTRARDHYKREGYPAVLFIDEADAILGARSRESTVGGMEKTIVPMFLAEMDGLDENGPLVLLATNRSDSLDPAIVRDGRVDRKIEVTRPTQEDAVEIFQMYLKGKPVSEATKPEYAEAFSKALFGSSLKLRVCGALIAGLVDQAISLAMRRDIAAGLSHPSGLTMNDIGAAIKATEAQNMKVQNG